jgi:hypothetical protein
MLDKTNISSILQPDKVQVNISIKEVKKPARTRVIKMNEAMKDTTTCYKKRSTQKN